MALETNKFTSSIPFKAREKQQRVRSLSHSDKWRFRGVNDLIAIKTKQTIILARVEICQFRRPTREHLAQTSR